MTPPPRLLAAVALGGGVGALLRYGAGEAVPDGSAGSGFPWTTFAINVLGSLLLALLPTLAAVRRSEVWPVALGPGVLGGFTTFSAYSEQTRALLAAGDLVLAGTYVLGTLAGCVAAVLLVDRMSSAADRDAVARGGGDE